MRGGPLMTCEVEPDPLLIPQILNISVNQYILIMAKPLLLKSNGPSIVDHKNQVLSVSELLKKFEIKSPSQKVAHLALPTSSIKHSIQSPKAHHSQIKLSDYKDFTANRAEEPRVHRKRQVKSQERLMTLKNTISMPKSNLPKASEQSSEKPPKQGVTLEGKKKVDKQNLNIVRKIKQSLSKISLYSAERSHPKIPSLKLPQYNRIKPFFPLSDRNIDENQLNRNFDVVSTRNSQKARLQAKQTLDVLSIKTSKHIKSSNYFRKGSSGSSKSLLSKHTISMQQMEDCEELFSKPSSTLATDRGGQLNPLQVLSQVKAKIYEQIDSLDRKLLETTNEDKRRLVKIICLKKRKEKGAIDLPSGLVGVSSMQIISNERTEQGERPLQQV